MYHLDGPDAVKHIPMIADVKELTGIQYIPGAGNDDIKHALPVYRKIQELGKVQWILEDISKIPVLTKRLVERGHSDEVILKFLGGNYMRVFEQVWKG